MARGQVSIQYKRADQFKALYIITSTFLDNSKEDKRFWTEWQNSPSSVQFLLKKNNFDLLLSSPYTWTYWIFKRSVRCLRIVFFPWIPLSRQLHFVFVVHTLRITCFQTSNIISLCICFCCLRLNEHVLCLRELNIAVEAHINMNHEQDSTRTFTNLCSNMFNGSADNRNSLKRATVYDFR
jgi:hypothetical protein